MRMRGTRPVVFAEALWPKALITPATAVMVTATPAPANAGFRLQSGGTAQKTNASGTYTTITGEWLVRGLPGQFECYATLISGDIASGTYGNWLALSSTRTWEYTNIIGASFTCSIQIMIRSIVRPTDVWCTTVSLTAESA